MDQRALCSHRFPFPPHPRPGPAGAKQRQFRRLLRKSVMKRPDLLGAVYKPALPPAERRIFFTTKTSLGRGDMSVAASPCNVSGQRCLSISPERDIIFIFPRLPIVRTSLNKTLNTQKAYRNTRFMENYLPAT